MALNRKCVDQRHGNASNLTTPSSQSWFSTYMARANAHTHTHRQRRTNAHTQTCTHTHTHIRTYVHKEMHAHTHTHRDNGFIWTFYDSMLLKSIATLCFLYLQITEV